MAQILLIGSDGLFEAVRNLLAPRGYAIEQAADCGHAGRLHAETPADLIIAEPSCTAGPELDRLRSLIRDHTRLKIITVAEAGTDAFLESHAVASDLGAVATIAQPVVAEELLFYVRACLEPLD